SADDDEERPGGADPSCRGQGQPIGRGGATLGRSLQSSGRSIGTQWVLDTGQHENGPKGGLCDGPQSLHANLAGTSRLSKPVPRLHPSASFEPCTAQREGGV